MTVEPISWHPNSYRVVNETGKEYYVNLNGDGPACDCAAGCYSDHPVPCRHVKAALVYRKGRPRA